MSKISQYRLGLILGAVINVSACVSTTTFKTDHNQYQLANKPELSDRQRADLYEAIIAGDLASFKQDHQSAMSYYLYAADISRNKQLIEQSIDAAQRANDALGLEQAALIWLAIEPQNIDALTLLLSAQLAQQNLADAAKTTDQLFTLVTSPEERYNLLSTYVINQDPRATFNLLRDLRQKYPNDVAVSSIISKLIMGLATRNQNPDNMLNQALTRAEEALSIDPLFEPAIRLKTHILVQLNQDDAARYYLSELFNNNRQSQSISHMLGQLLYDLQDLDAAIAHYTDWLMTHPQDTETRYYLAASYYASEDYADSLQQFDLLSNTDHEVNTVSFYGGDSAARLGQIDKAIAYFSRVNSGKFKVLAKIQLSQLYAIKKDYTRAREVLNASGFSEESDIAQLITAEVDLLKKHFSEEQAKQTLSNALLQYPENLNLNLKKIDIFNLTDNAPALVKHLQQALALIRSPAKVDRFNLAAAALLNNHGHYQQAVDWLNQALTNKPEDKDLLYARALYKENLGLHEDMIKEFKHLLALYPDDINIKNALGYTLADQNKELSLAQSLINEAIQAMPDNIAIIDSKGWLAYRMGNLEEAIEYLSKAFKLSPSADIAAHLGEVLWQYGKPELAKNIWQKGWEIEKENSVLQKTLERFKIEF
ncbi:tetratricopeptide repeat protein [Aliikangiella maris]|uniref:Tetratricopeptide repeat protein n=2 Tax=Aliikangiella maris TaxID=3162458 RepID=A0ABV3MN17_9GAMM